MGGELLRDQAASVIKHCLITFVGVHPTRSDELPAAVPLVLSGHAVLDVHLAEELQLRGARLPDQLRFQILIGNIVPRNVLAIFVGQLG